MFDTWYGDTDQETTKWALEYQLLTRMLVKENALILNPKYLELDLDLLEKIKNIIWVYRDFALKNKNPCSACEFQAKQGISIWGIKLLFFLYNHSKRTPFIV